MHQHHIEPTQQAIELLGKTRLNPKEYHLFVYGTLKRGCMNHIRLGLRDGGRFIREENLTGYRLRDIGSIPAIEQTNNQNDIVIGELWTIGDKYKQRLDILEYGYEFTEISPSIYCYIPITILKDHPLIPVVEPRYELNIYNWTPQLEIDSARSKSEANARKEAHDAQRN